MIYCQYEDSVWDIRSNIALFFWNFPWAFPYGTPLGGGLYLNVYPSSRPNTDTVYPPSCQARGSLIYENKVNG